jgi:hypothetical protein
MAELLGGSVSMESQPHVGSTFCVTIPIKAVDQAAEEGPSEGAGQAPIDEAGR